MGLADCVVDFKRGHRDTNYATYSDHSPNINRTSALYLYCLADVNLRVFRIIQIYIYIVVLTWIDHVRGDTCL